MEMLINLQIYSRLISSDNISGFLEILTKDPFYSIVDLETDELIGNCGFADIDLANRNAEVGIFIGNKEFWNKGYGTEALSLLLDYGFRALNLHNVMVNANENNKGAIRCYEKIGFKRIGIRREALQRNLEIINDVFMDLLTDDFYGNEQGGKGNGKA
jgi:RimJ/RimL family protein N-acetyltransferase